MRRRDFVKASAALALAGIPLADLFAAGAADLKVLGKPQPFDYAWLKGRRALAAGPYRLQSAIPNEVKAWIGISAGHHLPARPRYGPRTVCFQLKFLHLGLFFKSPVRMFEWSTARPGNWPMIPRCSTTAERAGRSALPRDLGFAGFKLLSHTDPVRHRRVSRASYFRAVGGRCSTASRPAVWPSTAG
jgi:glucans biosynthesis protein